MKPVVAAVRTAIAILTAIGLLCAAAVTPGVKELVGPSAETIARLGVAATALAGTITVIWRKLEDAGLVPLVLKREPPVQ